MQAQLDAVRLRAARAGVPLRPRSVETVAVATEEVEEEQDGADAEVGKKAVAYTPTQTLFIRVTQGQQGVLQIHQARS